jgi:hypothetical protein
MYIVKVEWIDAETKGDQGWQDLETAKEEAKKLPCVMTTVGFLLADFTTHICLTDSLGTEECGQVNKIPREMIKSMSVIDDPTENGFSGAYQSE